VGLLLSDGRRAVSCNNVDTGPSFIFAGRCRTTRRAGSLNCARGHGLNISYLGGWNERGHDSNWYKNLRTALNNNGFAGVQIVGDATLKNAVVVLGNHYVCGYLSQAESCGSSANAQSSGKPLWASEFGSQDFNDGAVPYIRTITRGYLDAQLTGFSYIYISRSVGESDGGPSAGVETQRRREPCPASSIGSPH
jgi:hypothetical protein